MNQTITALAKISNDFAKHPAVASIELLNEPFGYSLDRKIVEGFYTDTITDKVISNETVAANPPTDIAIHEAYYGIESWQSFMPDQKNLVSENDFR